MPIHKKKIAGILNSNPNDKCDSNVELKNQLRFTCSDSQRLLHSKQVKEVAPFVFWNDFWNRYGIYGPDRDNFKDAIASHRYARGRKVFVDFGCSNVGKETSLPHPAFVLYNFAETAIVVPTTSDDGSKFTQEMEVALIRCKGDGKVFPANTLINLHQMRVISKNRIIKDLSCSAKDYIVDNSVVDSINDGLSTPLIEYGSDLQKCMEAKIAKLYTPDVFINYCKNIDVSNKLTEDNKSLTEENEKLKEEIELLREKYESEIKEK